MATRSALSFMQEMIRTRRKELAAGAPLKNDILSLMIQSTEEESRSSKAGMTDDELVRRAHLSLACSWT